MRIAILAAIVLFSFPASAFRPTLTAGGATAGGGGGGGGGGACATPTNFVATAAHLYFWQDHDWATNSIPDDEGSGTDQNLDASANLDESADTTTADLPGGMPTGSTFYSVDLDGSTETAKTNLDEPGFAVASNYGDWTECFWIKASSIGGGDHISHFGNGDADGWTAFEADGSVVFATPLDSGSLVSANGSVSTGSWYHICTVDDGNGAGTSTRTIYVNGASLTSDSDLSLFDSGGTSPHGINASEPSLNHAWGIWHSALSAADIKTMACCGINGDVDDVSTRETLTGLDCSGE